MKRTYKLTVTEEVAVSESPPPRGLDHLYRRDLPQWSLGRHRVCFVFVFGESGRLLNVPSARIADTPRGESEGETDFDGS